MGADAEHSIGPQGETGRTGCKVWDPINEGVQEEQVMKDAKFGTPIMKGTTEQVRKGCKVWDPNNEGVQEEQVMKGCKVWDPNNEGDNRAGDERMQSLGPQ